MSNILEYKGYQTKIVYSAEDGLLCGKIEGIKDLVDFYSCTCESIVDGSAGIVEAFHTAVNDYFDMCQEVGKEPEQPKNAPKLGDIIYELCDNNKIYKMSITNIDSSHGDTTYEACLVSDPKAGVTQFAECDIGGPYVFLSYKEAMAARKERQID
jgi:predicted HicB family RNase H-like nuclease